MKIAVINQNVLPRMSVNKFDNEPRSVGMVPVNVLFPIMYDQCSKEINKLNETNSKQLLTPARTLLTET